MNMTTTDAAATKSTGPGPRALGPLPDWAALQADAEQAAAAFGAGGLSLGADADFETPRHFQVACVVLCVGWAVVAAVAFWLWSGVGSVHSAQARSDETMLPRWRAPVFSAYGNPPPPAESQRPVAPAVTAVAGVPASVPTAGEPVEAAGNPRR